MASTRQGGPGIGLDTKPMIGNNNVVTLAAGETFLMPAGQFYVTPGPYSFIQTKDPITSKWRAISSTPNTAAFLSADGANVRVANLTGCALGALITNVGSAYTSAPTVTASAGASGWTAIIGGAVNQTVTITTAGVGYNFTPQLVVSAPPAGGVQASAICTISAGAINAVTVINQGAGYAVAPTITVVPDAREAAAATPGPTTSAVLTAALTGSGTITALLCTDHGTPVTAVPTLTISGGGGASGAATAVMCFTVTGFTVGTAGAVYGNAQPFGILTTGGIVPGAVGAVINPQFDKSLLLPRQANISGTSTSGGAVTATGAVINDAGLFQAVPTGLVIASGTGALPTTTAIVTLTVGGITDTSFIQPF